MSDVSSPTASAPAASTDDERSETTATAADDATQAETAETTESAAAVDVMSEPASDEDEAAAEAPAADTNVDEDEPAAPPAAPPANRSVEEIDADVEPEAGEKHWYVVKVASNRERTVKKALERQIKREGLEDFFGDVFIPMQTVKETKNGKVVEKEEKKLPGYIFINMAITDDSFFLVRSISGIGDFAGKAGEPSPMPQEEVDALLGNAVAVEPGEEKAPEPVRINIPFAVGDTVKVTEGSLINSEGEVGAIDDQTGQVKVTIQFLGQPTDVEFEHWQLEKV